MITVSAILGYLLNIWPSIFTTSYQSSTLILPNYASCTIAYSITPPNYGMSGIITLGILYKMMHFFLAHTTPIRHTSSSWYSGINHTIPTLPKTLFPFPPYISPLSATELWVLPNICIYIMVFNILPIPPYNPWTGLCFHKISWPVTPPVKEYI